MKFGARNQLTGKVTEIKRGGVMCQVRLDVTGGEMNSVMTLESLADLGLKEGDKVGVKVGQDFAGAGRKSDADGR